MAKTAKKTKTESHAFQAEVAKLLHLMVHSVYSDRDVFLRELISNAADALDKLRYEAIAAPDLLEEAPQLNIVITELQGADRFIERLGFYSPLAGDGKESLRIALDRVQFWTHNGAQLSQTVSGLVKKAGANIAIAA